MTAGNVADGIGHGQDGEPKSQGHAQEADTEAGKGCCEHGASAAAEDKPKRADELGRTTSGKRNRSVHRVLSKKRFGYPLIPPDNIPGAEITLRPR